MYKDTGLWRETYQDTTAALGMRECVLGRKYIGACMCVSVHMVAWGYASHLVLFCTFYVIQLLLR